MAPLRSRSKTSPMSSKYTYLTSPIIYRQKLLDGDLICSSILGFPFPLQFLLLLPLEYTANASSELVRLNLLPICLWRQENPMSAVTSFYACLPEAPQASLYAIGVDRGGSQSRPGPLGPAKDPARALPQSCGGRSSPSLWGGQCSSHARVQLHQGLRGWHVVETYHRRGYAVIHSKEKHNSDPQAAAQPSSSVSQQPLRDGKTAAKIWWFCRQIWVIRWFGDWVIREGGGHRLVTIVIELVRQISDARSFHLRGWTGMARAPGARKRRPMPIPSRSTYKSAYVRDCYHAGNCTGWPTSCISSVLNAHTYRRYSFLKTNLHRIRAWLKLVLSHMPMEEKMQLMSSTSLATEDSRPPVPYECDLQAQNQPGPYWTFFAETKNLLVTL